MQQYVFKPSRKVDGVKHTNKFYSCKIRMEWWLRSKVFALHTTDEREARRKMQRLVDDFEKERNGLLPPLSVRDAIKQPIWQHLEAYLADLKARRRQRGTIDKYRTNLTTLFKRCKWDTLRNVTARSFLDWRSACTLAPKSVNDMLATASMLFRWLKAQKLLTDNPLESVQRVDTRRAENYRRALSEADAQRLLAVAPYDRAVIYLLAMNTGMRRKEMALLTWDDFNFTAQPPTVRLPASITKNGKEALLYLRPEVAAVMQAQRPQPFTGTQTVFRSIPKVATLRRDLEKIGVPFKDEKNRRLDLHALRVTYGTNLSKQGVQPRVAMELMRHSDIKLTMKVYTDASQLPLAQAVQSLPAFTLAEKTHTKTHTNSTQKDIQTGVAGCPAVSLPDASEQGPSVLQSA